MCTLKTVWSLVQRPYSAEPLCCLIIHVNLHSLLHQLAAELWVHQLAKQGRFGFEAGAKYQLLQQSRPVMLCWKSSEHPLAGTFGRVLECWDRKNKEYVAIKIVRNVQKYRDAAMIEVRAPIRFFETFFSISRGNFGLPCLAWPPAEPCA